MTLFPRKLFNDALPQIVLKHQLYSIHSDRTLVDKELVRWILSVRNVRVIVSADSNVKYNVLLSSVHRIRCVNEETC